jgi:hypothetical protein
MRSTAEMNNPTSPHVLATQTTNNAGQTTAGVGFINVSSIALPSRQGTIVARFRF